MENLPEIAKDASAATLAIVVIGDGGETKLVHDGSAPEVMRARIDDLKDRMLALAGEPCDLRVEHSLLDGIYTRKMFIPKGQIVVGKIHLKPCINVVAKGDITVLTELGCVRLKEGATGISGRGIQKVGLAHEDTIFINVFRTDKTSIAEIEEEIAGEVHVPVEIVGQQLKELQ